MITLWLAIGVLVLVVISLAVRTIQFERAQREDSRFLAGVVSRMHGRIDKCLTKEQLDSAIRPARQGFDRLSSKYDEVRTELSKCLNVEQLQEAVAALRTHLGPEPHAAPQTPTMRERILDFYSQHERDFYFYKDVAAAQGIEAKANSLRAEFSDLAKAGLLERGKAGTYRRAA